jgi:hypothetical protein
MDRKGVRPRHNEHLKERPREVKSVSIFSSFMASYGRVLVSALVLVGIFVIFLHVYQFFKSDEEIAFLLQSILSFLVLIFVTLTVWTRGK